MAPFVNPFGAPGTVPAFAPQFQGNARVRYDWTMDKYNPFVMAGVSYTGSMYNQPATYTSGDGVAVPNTTFLRYLQPAYTTVDAAIGVTNDNWYAQILRPEPEQLPRQHVHLLGPVHQVGSAAAAAGDRPEARRQFLKAPSFGYQSAAGRAAAPARSV